MASYDMSIETLLCRNLELRAGISGENYGSSRGQFDLILASDDTEVDACSLRIKNGEGSVLGHAHLNDLAPVFVAYRIPLGVSVGRNRND